MQLIQYEPGPGCEHCNDTGWEPKRPDDGLRLPCLVCADQDQDPTYGNDLNQQAEIIMEWLNRENPRIVHVEDRDYWKDKAERYEEGLSYARAKLDAALHKATMHVRPKIAEDLVRAAKNHIDIALRDPYKATEDLSPQSDQQSSSSDLP